MWRLCQETAHQGAGTHDIGFEWDQRNNGITHKIDPQIDKERDFIEQSFADAGNLQAAAYVTPSNPLRDARTATGGGFHPNTGYDLISRLLAIIIRGGMGSIAGAMLAAIFMITLEAVVDVLWSPSWSVVVFYGALVLVLAIRPQGVFGKKAARAQ